MQLTPGTRIGPYEVTGALGAGGMGEVYRGRDARLNRDVAIKVLPELFADDPERLARFTREAQALAALNHPNIAHVYGIEETAIQGGRGIARALVMELVEGQDLSERIAAGPLPVADAVAMARQLADALECAHEQGIIHRDFKPGNIRVRPDGAVKILDFGLAKIWTHDADAVADDLANSPTVTARATQMGVIIGTAAYMAPEQAKGKPVDRRADIWAFGVVIYEMLTGRRAFEGEDVSTTLAAVLMKDPDMGAIPASVPAALRRLVSRCLERDPRQRLRDIGEARILLGDPAAAGDEQASVQPSPTPARASRLPWIVAGVSVAAAAALAVPALFRAEPESPAVRFHVTYPPSVHAVTAGGGGDYTGGAVSPDGQYVAFSGAETDSGRIAIYLRRIDGVDITKVKGTEGGQYPFWSPTGKSIAFYSDGKLSRVEIDGSSPQAICDAPTGGWGGSWNRDDIIIAGLTDPGPIFKVSAKGGDTPVPVTTVGAGATDHDWPHFLPDGRHFIYTVWKLTGTATGDVAVGSIDVPFEKVLFGGLEEAAGFADPDSVMFIRGRTLMAQRLDVNSLDLKGDPQPVAANAAAPIDGSPSGALTYATGDAGLMSRMVWVNRDGTGERVVLGSGLYADPAVSPDGTRIAYARRESERGSLDIWIREIATGAENRLTGDPADDRSPVWSPDSREVVFSSQRDPVGLYRKNANGTGAETLITPKGEPRVWPYQWHSRGFIALFGDFGKSWDVWELSLPDLRLDPLVASANHEARGAVSPDGRWLAYDARESARFEVFLTTFPPSASRLSVTTEGGAEPKWSADGRELFYVSSTTGALMAAPVSLSDPPTFGTPRQIHPGPIKWGWNSSHSYDIDPVTGRLLLQLQNSTGDLTVLLNWQAMLKR